MVRHWLAVREPGWWWRATLNACGALLTFVVLLVVASVKFSGGAYLVVVLIPMLVLLMVFIRHQYDATAQQLALRPGVSYPPFKRDERVVVPVSGINRAVVRAVDVGRAISDDVRAVLVSDDPDEAEETAHAMGTQHSRRAARRRRVALSRAERAADRLSRRAWTRAGRRTRRCPSPS